MVSKDGSGFWDDEDWDILNAVSQEREKDPPGLKARQPYYYDQSSIRSNTDQQQQQKGFEIDLPASLIPSNRSVATTIATTVTADASTRSSLSGCFQSPHPSIHSQLGSANDLKFPSAPTIGVGATRSYSEGYKNDGSVQQAGGAPSEITTTTTATDDADDDAMSVGEPQAVAAPLSPSVTRTPTSGRPGKRKSVMEFVKNMLKSPTAGSSQRRRSRSFSAGPGRRFRSRATTTNDNDDNTENNDNNELGGGGDKDKNSVETSRPRSSSVGAGRRSRPRNTNKEQEEEKQVAAENDITSNDPLANHNTHRASSLTDLEETTDSFPNLNADTTTETPHRPVRSASIGAGYRSTSSGGLGGGSVAAAVGLLDQALRDPTLARQRRRMIRQQLVTPTPAKVMASEHHQAHPMTVSVLPSTPALGLMDNDDDGENTNNIQLPFDEQTASATAVTDEAIPSDASRPPSTILRLNDESDVKKSRRQNLQRSASQHWSHEANDKREKRSSSVGARPRRGEKNDKDEPSPDTTSVASKKKRKKVKSKKPSSIKRRSPSRGRSRKTRSTSPKKDDSSRKESKSPNKHSLSPRRRVDEKQVTTSDKKSNSNGDIGSSEMDAVQQKKKEKTPSAESIIQATLDGKPVAKNRSSSRGRSRKTRSESPEFSPGTQQGGRRTKLSTPVGSTGKKKTTKIKDDDKTTSSRSSSKSSIRPKPTSPAPVTDEGGDEQTTKAETIKAEKVPRNDPITSQPFPGGKIIKESSSSTGSRTMKTRFATSKANDDDCDGDGDGKVFRRQESFKKSTRPSRRALMMDRSKSMSRLNCSPSTLPSSDSAAPSGIIKEKKVLIRSLSSNNLGRSSNPGDDTKPRRRRIKYQPTASKENKKKEEENGRRDAVHDDSGNDDPVNIASTESGCGHTSVSHIQSAEAFHNSVDSSMVEQNKKESGNNDGDSTAARRRPKEKVVLSRQ